jgi:GT2 family glycosyltransferase
MLNISIVLYNPQWQQIVSLTESLLLYPKVRHIYWIDNSGSSAKELPISSQKISYIFNGRNLGYGAAHNIAIRQSIYDDVPYHLVINPDIIITPETLNVLVSFLEEHKMVGCVTPKVIYPDGELQYLCKLLPTPLDVFGRRFLPKRWIERRNRRYELRDSGYNRIMNIPYLSGCFMLFRTEAVRKARLFDERFFMYPEDVDLTRRIHRDYLTVYYPHTTIIHNHAKASYRSLRMLWVHIVNMCRYFNKWGWWHDPERKMMNDLAINEYINSSQHPQPPRDTCGD